MYACVHAALEAIERYVTYARQEAMEKTSPLFPGAQERCNTEAMDTKLDRSEV